MIVRSAMLAASLAAAVAGVRPVAAAAYATTAPAAVATHAAVPVPRATFVVTIKSRRSGRTKVSSWTTVPIRPNGTLQTSRNVPAPNVSTAAAVASPPGRR